jgi:hypothetical protein
VLNSSSELCSSVCSRACWSKMSPSICAFTTTSRSPERPAISRRTLAVALLCAFATACGDGTTESIALAMAQIPGDFYGEWPVQTYVARNAAEWAQIWASHKPLTIPVPVMPVVDFSAYTVVGIALGRRPSGCYATEIVDATGTESQITVQFRELTPPPGVGCTAALVFPVQFVTIPRTDKPVTFVQIT